MATSKPPAMKPVAKKSKKKPGKNDGRNGCLMIVALVVFIFVAAWACSPKDSSPSSAPSDGAAASADESHSAAAASDDAVSGSPPAQTVTYTCDGGGVTSVTVTSSGNSATVTWSGEASTPATQFTEYVVTLNRDDGNKVHTLYQKNRVGGGTELSVWDADANSRSQPGGTASGPQTFPDALAGFGTQGWHGNAAVNVDGQDVAHCS